MTQIVNTGKQSHILVINKRCQISEHHGHVRINAICAETDLFLLVTVTLTFKTNWPQKQSHAS